MIHANATDRTPGLTDVVQLTAITTSRAASETHARSIMFVSVRFRSIGHARASIRAEFRGRGEHESPVRHSLPLPKRPLGHIVASRYAESDRLKYASGPREVQRTLSNPLRVSREAP